MEEEKILVFDSSILLRMYRHSYEDIEKLLKDLEKEENNIWIPHQTYIEFKENKESQKLNTLAIGQYNKAINDLNNIIKESQEKIKTQIEVYKGRRFPKIRSLEEEIKNQYSGFNPLMKKYKDIYKNHTDKSRKLHKTDPINSLIDKLQFNDQVGKEYPISKLLTIYEEAEKRYTYKLPPGYMDDLRYNKEDGKKGVEKYGDYLIWKQMIDKSKEEDIGIIFITNDQKPDWLKKGKLREDLVEEFKELTDGQNIKRLSFENLIKEELNITLNPSLKLELFPENYINKTEIESVIKLSIDRSDPDVSIHLENVVKCEGLIIENIEIDDIKEVQLNLDEIEIQDMDENEITYQLELEGKIIYILNDFYKVELSITFFISTYFEIGIKEDGFVLTYSYFDLEDAEVNSHKILSYLDICPMCQIREGIDQYESGELICPSCSSDLICCSDCGTYFHSDSDQLTGCGFCKTCFEEKL